LKLKFWETDAGVMVCGNNSKSTNLIKLMIRIKETASNHSPEYILFFRELNLMEKYVV
jgi:hypothetical protein